MGYLPTHRAARARSNPLAVRGALATAAVTALVASPLALAPAQAATDHTWNRLAQCESSGNWHINIGNGYFGGVQFSEPTWRAFGGGRFAGYANRASRNQQVTVAQRVLRTQGWGAWPACSARLGLTHAQAVAPRRPAPRPVRHHHGPAKRHHAHHRTMAHHRGTHGYTVRPGDTLSRIAAREHVAGGWRAVYRVNRAVIGSNPNMIRVGQHLRLP
ncbi:MAG: transglycosylase family protein [Nocardioidaceae bacterium]